MEGFCNRHHNLIIRKEDGHPQCGKCIAEKDAKNPKRVAALRRAREEEEDALNEGRSLSPGKRGAAMPDSVKDAVVAHVREDRSNGWISRKLGIDPRTVAKIRRERGLGPSVAGNQWTSSVSAAQRTAPE